jgi:hypothetical protein
MEYRGAECEKGWRIAHRHGSSTLYGADAGVHAERAEKLLLGVENQGAPNVSQCRYEVRRRTAAAGQISIPKTLFDDILALWVVGLGMARDRRFRISAPSEITVASR